MHQAIMSLRNKQLQLRSSAADSLFALGLLGFDGNLSLKKETPPDIDLKQVSASTLLNRPEIPVTVGVDLDLPICDYSHLDKDTPRRFLEDVEIDATYKLALGENKIDAMKAELYKEIFEVHRLEKWNKRCTQTLAALQAEKAADIVAPIEAITHTPAKNNDGQLPAPVQPKPSLLSRLKTFLWSLFDWIKVKASVPFQWMIQRFSKV